MSKEWKCGDCVCFGTDACHYPSMLEEYVACEHLVVDHDKAYQQGRADAINEFVKHCDNATTCLTEYTVTMKEIRIIAEQIKEQNSNSNSK